MTGLKKIPACASAILRQYFPNTDLEAINITTEAPSFPPELVAAYNSPGAHAVTYDGTIYFKPGHYDPHSADGIALIGHEVEHIVQQGKTSSDLHEFLNNYANAYIENRLTMNEHEAYLNIPYEKEAHAIAEIIKQDLDNFHGEKGKTQSCP